MDILKLTFNLYPNIRFAGLMLVVGAALVKHRRTGHVCDVANVRDYVDPSWTRAEIAKAIATRALDLSKRHHFHATA